MSMLMSRLLDFRVHMSTLMSIPDFGLAMSTAIYLPKSSDMFMSILMCILHDLVYYLAKSCNMLMSMFMSILHDFHDISTCL